MSYDVELRWSARGRQEAMKRVTSTVILPDDFCFLVSRADGRPVQPAFDFLTNTYLSGVRTRALTVAKNTIKAVVDDLSDFHNFLDANGLLVSNVDEEALENYLRSMTIMSSPVTGRPYENGTVLRRRSSVARFLHFCQDRGLLKHRFTVGKVSTPHGVVERFAPNLPGPRADPIDKLVRAVDPRLLEPFLQELGTPPIESASEPDSDDLRISTMQDRKRLMAEVCLHTGLRRAEVCSLQASAINKLSLEGRDLFTSIAVRVIGKGSKSRHVPFPVWLLLALQRYAGETREPMVQIALKSGAMKADHQILFVLETPRNGTRGRPVTPKMFNSEFADARDRFIEKLRGDAVNPGLLQLACHARITVHALRHTFALITFISRREQGDPCPAKYVQSVLGHSYQETTEKIYLRSSHVYESELAQTVEKLIEERQRAARETPHTAETSMKDNA